MVELKMDNLKKYYFVLIILHVFIGGMFFFIPFLSKIYGILIILIGLYVVISSKDRDNQALFVSGYLVGSEVMLRMTDGNLLHEITKYSVTIIMFVGILYNGAKKGSYTYLLFLLLLMPSVFIGVLDLDADTDVRKAILFNVSGPFCLGISAIYCYKRDITFQSLSNLLLSIGLPILSTVVYIVFYNPNVGGSVFNTQSNYETSGGFGPNQVATILGLGAFIFFTRVVLFSKTKSLIFINIVLLILIVYRGISTFSRGGMITSAVMASIFIITLYKLATANVKFKILFLIIFSFIGFLGIWSYTSLETNGMIDKRYANEGVKGNKKESQLSGREVLIASELDMFYENPFLGVGVGKNRELRTQETGIQAASHNEITRLLAEHGLLGILALMILMIVPIALSFYNKQNIYVFCFLVFWLLTINHAAMRIAAPAFIYSLSLLKVKIVNEKPDIHRKQVV